KELFISLHHRVTQRTASLRSGICCTHRFNGYGEHCRRCIIYDVFRIGNHPVNVCFCRSRKCSQPANPPKNPEVFTLSDDPAWNYLYSPGIEPEYPVHFTSRSKLANRWGRALSLSNL